MFRGDPTLFVFGAPGITYGNFTGIFIIANNQAGMSCIHVFPKPNFAFFFFELLLPCIPVVY